MVNKRTNYLILAQKLTYFYMFVMSSIFIFWFTNFYYNITDSKYAFFSTISVLFFAPICILYILHVLEIKRYSNEKLSTIIHWNKVDWFMLLFLLSQVVTTVLSQYTKISLFGYVRHTGLIFSMLLVGTYFIVSKLYLQQQSIVLMFLFSVSLAVIVGLFQFFYIDPFHFLTYVSDYQGSLYLSTVGNINFFSAIICLSLTLSLGLFLFSEDKFSKCIYMISIVINSLGLLISNSDSGYFGIFCILLVMMFYSFKNIKYLKKFILEMIVFLSTYKIFGIFIYFLKDFCRGIHSFSYFISYRSITLVLLLFCILFYFFMDAYPNWIDNHLLKIRKWLMRFVLFFVIVVVSAILYFSFVNTEMNIGPFANYLRYDDFWGTGRGMIWNNVLFSFSKLSLVHKLFGNGLDTTGQLLMSQFGNAMIRYDNAHNEMIQYLATIGIVGLGLYLSFIFSLVKKSVLIMKKEPYVFVLICVVVCYVLQSIFNINQPTSTPLFYMFLGMLQSFINMEEEEDI